MNDIFEYDVFLSFASADEELVKPIWQEMSSSGLRVFWSDETLKQNIGQDFDKVIENAVINSEHFVLICTEKAFESEWVDLEYRTFRTQCYLPSSGKRRLILFGAEEFNKSLLPPFLSNIHLSDSVKQIISILGGVNIQALKQENKLLKQRVETALKEKSELENQFKEKDIPKRKLKIAWILISFLLVLIVSYAIVNKLTSDKSQEIARLKQDIAAEKAELKTCIEEKYNLEKYNLMYDPQGIQVINIDDKKFWRTSFQKPSHVKPPIALTWCKSESKHVSVNVEGEDKTTFQSEDFKPWEVIKRNFFQYDKQKYFSFRVKISPHPNEEDGEVLELHLKVSPQ